ncbi:hypothetical protein BC829DRAFT_391132 [Chytridium lagenaria]|nr:hypothetical protein BC829DRAFT_391132 [Chytridium lagenaria]
METNAVSPEVTTTSQPTQLLPTAEPNATSVEPTPIGLSTSPSHPSLLEAQRESVIGLYHLKSKKADAALAATDAGTITVYDLTLPPQWSGINVKEIREDCSVVAVWHARTPLLGMQVVEVATPVGSEKSRWKVVVWGRNGFSTVLSLQI